MAIDTETKRKSMLGFGSGDLLPKQDGTIDAGDRLTLLWLYYGIAADAATQVTGRLEYTFSKLSEFTFDLIPDFTFPKIPDEEMPAP